MRKFFTLSLLLHVVFLSSCARQISSNTYSESSIGEVSQTYPGIVISQREVTVEGSESLQDNSLGIVGGGAAGALLGSEMGKGKGNLVSTLATGVVGAVAGAYAEKSLKTQNAIRLEMTVNAQGRKITL